MFELTLKQNDSVLDEMSDMLGGEKYIVGFVAGKMARPDAAHFEKQKRLGSEYGGDLAKASEVMWRENKCGTLYSALK